MLESILQSGAWYSAFMFIIVLSILVFVHELGHYLAAKSVGVKVKAFSIGFGKEIVGYTRKNGERWKLSLVPLGGYVDIYGMDEEADDVKDEKDKSKLKDAYFKKNVWARIWVVFAGPFANFLFAIVALTALFSTSGIQEASSRIGDVMSNMPAEKAGLKANDLITSINGVEITKWSELTGTIVNTQVDQDIALTVDRDGELFNVVLKAEDKEVETILEEKIKKRLIGITMSSDYIMSEQVSFIDAVEKSVISTYNMSALILTSVKRMITGEMKANVGGPLTIAEQSGEAAKGGMYALIMFMVMISINLGILNLLPIPVLDGGHILYCLIEICTFGRGLHDTIKMIANYIGLGLLILLMVFAFYKDISRIFFE